MNREDDNQLAESGTMQTLTVELSDPIFREVAARAQEASKQPADVVRDLVDFHFGQADANMKDHSLKDHKPISVGQLLKPWTSNSE